MGSGSVLQRGLNKLSSNDVDPSILKAREHVDQAEAAERDADRALEEARRRVREAHGEMRRLEKEIEEEARRAKIKQQHAAEVSKRGKGLGRKYTAVYIDRFYFDWALTNYVDRPWSLSFSLQRPIGFDVIVSREHAQIAVPRAHVFGCPNRFARLARLLNFACSGRHVMAGAMLRHWLGRVLVGYGWRV